MVLNHNQDQLFTGRVTFAGPVTLINPANMDPSIDDGQVVCASAGNIIKASSDNLEHADRLMGLKMGERAVATSGYLRFDTWFMPPGLPMYLNSSGYPTHVVPSAGFQQQVGIAIDEHTMLVLIGQAVILI